MVGKVVIRADLAYILTYYVVFEPKESGDKKLDYQPKSGNAQLNGLTSDQKEQGGYDEQKECPQVNCQKEICLDGRIVHVQPYPPEAVNGNDGKKNPYERQVVTGLVKEFIYLFNNFG